MGLNVVPVLIGIILGVPVVGRELELRTAGFSWALTASRSRWLMARLVPMALVGVVALGVLALAGRYLFDAIWLGRYGPELTEGRHGGRGAGAAGLAAFGVGLLLGALVGRDAALLIGVAVMAAWGLLVVPQAQAGSSRPGPCGWATRRGRTAPHRSPTPTRRHVRRVQGRVCPASPGCASTSRRCMSRSTPRSAPRAARHRYGDENGPGSPGYQTWARCAEPIQTAGEAPLNRWNRSCHAAHGPTTVHGHGHEPRGGCGRSLSPSWSSRGRRVTAYRPVGVSPAATASAQPAVR
ncbi:MAG: hypothetical protein R3C32_11630 [Chloroflexota bacterium]